MARNNNNKLRCSSLGSLLLRSIESSLCAPFVMLWAVHNFNYADAPVLVTSTLVSNQVGIIAAWHPTQKTIALCSNSRSLCFRHRHFERSVWMWFASFLPYARNICIIYSYSTNQNRKETKKKQTEAKYTNKKSIKWMARANVLCSVRPFGHLAIRHSAGTRCVFPFIFVADEIICFSLDSAFYNLTVHIFILITTIGGPVHTRSCSFAF